MGSTPIRSAAKATPAIGLAEIAALEKLRDDERMVALRKRGAGAILDALAEWKVVEASALTLVRSLSDGRDAFLITAPAEDGRAYDEKLADANRHLDQTGLIVGRVAKYVEIVQQAEIDDGVWAYATELNANRDKLSADLLSQAKKGLTILADVVAKAKQFDFETAAINKLLPSVGIERVAPLSAPIHGVPGVSSLFELISSFFPITTAPNEQTIAPAQVSGATLPAAVKSALAQAAAGKRSSIAPDAIGLVPLGHGLASAPGEWRAPESHALPQNSEPEPQERGFKPAVRVTPER